MTTAIRARTARSTFDDTISTIPIANDLQGNNPSLDTRGSRTVQSAYVELQVPLVSKDMAIPLVQTVDMQLAARYENFDYVRIGDEAEGRAFVAAVRLDAGAFGMVGRFPRTEPAAAV